MANSSADLLRSTNARLRAARTGCTLEDRSGYLYIRGTFPSKPGSGRSQSYQQRHALKAQATPENIKKAEKLCRKVGIALSEGISIWGLFSDVQPADISSFGYWVGKFEEDYWNRRQKDKQTLGTWDTHYAYPFGHLPLDKPLTIAAMVESAKRFPPEKSARRTLVQAYVSLARFAGLDPEPLERIRGSYTPGSVTERKLPTDEEIEATWEAIANPRWRWVFGMVAAFGIRPHELFYLELEENEYHVLESTKTGVRTLKPLHPHWAEQWDLFVPKYPNWTADIDTVTNKRLGNKISCAFKAQDIPHSPYDYRHAWARRARNYLRLESAAYFMGHSPMVHRQTYLRWVGNEPYLEDYERAVRKR